MTVKELIRELQNVPEDAIVAYHPETADKPYIADGVIYNDATNTISFYGGDVFKFEDENSDIPDDVDESNYDPCCGCDMFEICGSIDEEW